MKKRPDSSYLYYNNNWINDLNSVIVFIGYDVYGLLVIKIFVKYNLLSDNLVSFLKEIYYCNNFLWMSAQILSCKSSDFLAYVMPNHSCTIHTGTPNLHKFIDLKKFQSSIKYYFESLFIFF